jgi:cobalt/nickel transport system permease protein
LVAVFLGRSEEIELKSKMLSLALLQTYIVLLVLLAKLNLRFFFLRVALILPFGGSIALLRPFFEPGEVIFSFYVINVTREGVAAGAVLLAIIVVSVSAVVLLSSTTRMQALIAALRSFRVPGEVVLILGMTLRFIFLYMRSFQEVVQAQRNRAFSLRSKRVKRSHVLRVLAYTAAMIFIRAYKHGEAIYQAMLSRGYNPEMLRSWQAKKLRGRDYLFACVSLAVFALAAWVAF